MHAVRKHVCGGEMQAGVEIKKISSDTVHKICSGQVVLTLAVAVKELVENGLDAGANTIEIKLKNNGLESVEVIDNGSGIKPENFQALTLKHFTSKISEFSDLAGVETFGFRGEALSSLCSLSGLVVVTRHADQPVGARIEYDNNGKIKTISNCAREIGTTVMLSNLFHTLPVRQKEFNRNIKKEFGRMIRMLQGYCLVLENTRITCSNQLPGTRKQLTLSTVSTNKMIDNISCVFGSKQAAQVVPIVQCAGIVSSPTGIEEGESPLCLAKTQEKSPPVQDVFNAFKITGYISKCTHGFGRSTTDRQFFSFNGRPCDHAKLAKTVNEVYHMYNRHQFPFVALNITTSRDKVDVNLTPDKRMILVQEEKILLSIVKESLIEMFEPMQGELESKSTTPSFSFAPNPDVPSLVTPSGTTMCRDILSSPTSLTTPFCDASALSDDKEEELGIATLERSSSIGSNASLFNLQSFSCSQSSQKHASKSKQPKLTDFGLLKTTSTNQSFSNSVQGVKPVKSKLLHVIKPDATKRIWTPCESTEKEKSRNVQKSSSVDNKEEQTVCYDDDRCVAIAQHANTTTINLDLDVQRSNRKFFHATIEPDSNKQAEDELRKELTKESFKDMEVIGQFNLGFVIAKLEDHLFIIDQHATDEKYNYERLQRDTEIEHQTLIQPLTLELTVVGESVVMENEEVFAKNGFQFLYDDSAPPTKRIKLVSQPVSKNWSMGISEIEELIFLLTDYPGEMVRPACVNKMFATRACRGSIMIGTPLDVKEMKKLLVHMSEMNQPWNCPHGRPTFRHLLDLSRLK